jgi:toxin CcdB
MTHFDRYRTPVVVLLDMVSVVVDQLGEVVGSLAQEGQIIADALDELLTRSWG